MDWCGRIAESLGDDFVAYVSVCVNINLSGKKTR